MNAYGVCQLHVTFHTKFSKPVLPEAHEELLYSYMAGVLKEHYCHPIQIGGYDDHIHAFFDLGRKITISDAVGKLKSNSSRWLSDSELYPDFEGWQRGYGYFSVSASRRQQTIGYIAAQRYKHGRHMTFRQEVKRFLELYGVEYDEAYLPEEYEG